MFKKIINANENLKKHILRTPTRYSNALSELVERTSMLNMKIFSIQVLLNIESFK